jgi:hypothetical protein
MMIIIQRIQRMNPIAQIQKLAGMTHVPVEAGRSIKNAVLIKEVNVLNDYELTILI